MDTFWYNLARAYGFVYGMVLAVTGRRIRGLLPFLRRIRKPHVFRVKGRTMFLSPSVAASYACLPGGWYVEPETHGFLNRVLAGLSVPVRFVDVGANVGAMVIHLAGAPNVDSCVAFEPIADCAEAIRRSLLLNNFGPVEVRPIALGAHPGRGHLHIDPRCQTSSWVVVDDPSLPANVTVSTLDRELAACAYPSICLIDVEGSEFDVLRGGSEFIRRERPLLIFEYNEIGRARYTLDDVRDALPEDYTVHRLRSDGRLDDDFDRTWNCCAVPSGTVFDEPCRRLMRPRA